MVNCQINKVTTKKALESYIGEIFHTGKKIICAKGTPNSFFSSTTTDFIISAKSQPISCKFAKFQKFRKIRETGKLLEPQANSRKFFVVNHKWPKLSFLTKRQ